ncbi:MAG: hypothetical protein ACR2PG_22375 [Hyphomicrobiaceae bacterium]
MFANTVSDNIFAKPRTGSRFRIFIQPPMTPAFQFPETIVLPAAPGEIGVGPSDSRFYTVSPAQKKKPYDPPNSLPPFDGPMHEPAVPDRRGHFDKIPVESAAFRSAHVFACARMTLAAWERFLGRPIPWAFHFPQMELVPEVDWSNAHSGYGFIELGHSAKRSDGVLVPYWLNFDVVAHEVGHAILFSLMPLSSGTKPSREYRAFHETGSDMVAILAAMHSEQLLRHVLDSTSGDIYGFNELNRLGEVSSVEQVRMACNDKRVQDVAGAEKVHIYSLPVTGAIFDILSLNYLRQLQRRNAIPSEIVEELLNSDHVGDAFPRLHRVFETAYSANHDLFLAALKDARDYVGTLLANTFAQLHADSLSYLNVANTLLFVNQRLFGGYDESELAEIFLWRGIGSGYSRC